MDNKQIIEQLKYWCNDYDYCKSEIDRNQTIEIIKAYVSKFTEEEIII